MLRVVSGPGSLEYCVGPHVTGTGIAGLRNDQFIDIPLSKKIKGTCLSSLSERELRLRGWIPCSRSQPGGDAVIPDCVSVLFSPGKVVTNLVLISANKCPIQLL